MKRQQIKHLSEGLNIDPFLSEAICDVSVSLTEQLQVQSS